MAEKEKTTRGLVVDGIIGSELVDSSGEILDIKGCDTSSLESGDAVLNHEHDGESGHGTKTFNSIIGKCIFSKKIFKKADCSNDREKMYWDQVEVPFIYGVMRLFDESGHPNAVAAAAIIRDQAASGEAQILRWSIEGGTIEKQGNRLARSVARSVALTARPCNKTCNINVLSDPQNEEQSKDELASVLEDVSKNEFSLNQKLSSVPFTYIPFEAEPEELLVKSLNDLKKAYGGVPGAQVGSDALERPVTAPTEEHKNRAKAALRDYDPHSHGPFKTYIKTQLPEASDEFIEHFSDLVDDLSLQGKMKFLRKDEFTLTKAQNPADELKARMPREFNGKAVIPGQVQMMGGYNDKFLNPLVHQSEHGHVIVGDDGKHQKLNPKDEGTKFKILSSPTYKKAGLVLNHVQHGLPNMAHSPEQMSLVNGVDLEKMTGKGEGSSFTAKAGGSSGWVKAPSGKVGWVKSSNVMNQIDPTDTSFNKFSSAQREVAFHHLAKNFFGMGEHVPVTAAVSHPLTGEHYSIQEKAGGEHFNESPHHTALLHHLLNKGTLDKAGLMDSILGNGDRHVGNWMLDPNSPHKLNLIDNGLAFSKDPNEVPQLSGFWRTAGANAHGDEYSFLNTPLHPEAQRWLGELDPKKLDSEMKTLGIPAPHRAEATRRLTMMKKRAILPGATRGQTAMSPFTDEKSWVNANKGTAVG